MDKREKIQRTYKFRLYPNKNQENRLLENKELCRFTYNLLLEEFNNQEVKDRAEIQALIPDLKICYPELNKVYSKTLQYECYRLFSNLKALSRLKKKGKKVGKLRFKSRDSFKSITYNQSGFKFIKSKKRLQRLQLSKIGVIPIRAHREIQGKIKQITIKKYPSGKWFANITCDNLFEKKLYQKESNNKQIGIDLGLTNYAYDSDNNHFDNPKFLNKSLKVLRKQQRKLSKKQKGSKNRNKIRLRVAKLHERVENQRNDFLHKLSKYYVNNYNLIALEDLQIQNMLQNKYLTKSISDSSWSKFIQMLEYKAESAGVQVIKVDPKGTTQECSNCGKIVKKKLSDREHNCDCGLKINRDYNSSINILNKSTVGRTGSNVWGDASMETSMNQKSQAFN